ncbi:helix-turn-helix domain-containing protein [Nocardia sp. alder85J]|uniref:helix-turn-helix domain-containing protein n=1 Tax=Nocardia sp. alder85J TaxID=2862949 RepID=UPI001CD2E4E9|nr:helix-turn-helix transcriptional regulator [Nocardia sp. alder85J]MCX4092505.1 helix-turn-helix transcriptional regulator [Nocardia sp. alder85J]
MTNVDQAREALGARLRELRRGARMSGIALATACGWHSSKVSRIEHGKQSPTEDDLAQWCDAVDNPAVLDDLVASLRNLRAMYLEWQRTVAAGHAHRQRQSIQLEGHTKLIRWWSPDVTPGLLQTEPYARAVLTACIAVTGGRDDLDEALAARMQRQRVLEHGNHRFHMIVGEWALHRTVGDDAVMLGQLDRLYDTTTHPRIRLGILPLTAEYRLPAANFVIYDRTQVLTETVSAELTITRPSEIALHEKTFAVLAEQAAYGDEARALIRTAAERRR